MKPANEEMSGGAKRSPLDLLVLPQPVDFFPKKIDKITKNFNERARLRSRIRITGVDADTRPRPRLFVKNFCDFVNFSRIKFHRLRMNQEIERTPLRFAAHLLVMPKKKSTDDKSTQ